MVSHSVSTPKKGYRLTSLPALRVIRVLEQLKDSHPLPEQIRVDNGPELISSKLVAWCEQNGVRLHHIQPGKPTQNAYVERFNRTMRREVLDANLFANLTEVRECSVPRNNWTGNISFLKLGELRKKNQTHSGRGQADDSLSGSGAESPRLCLGQKGGLQ